MEVIVACEKQNMSANEKGCTNGCNELGDVSDMILSVQTPVSSSYQCLTSFPK